MNIYISSSIKENLKDTVDVANQLNANIEICKFADSKILDGDFEIELNQCLESLRDFQGILSLHGTFFDLNPASKDSKITDITSYRYNQTLIAAKTLNAKTVVFHTGYNGQVKAEGYHNLFIENQIIFWTEFIKRFEDADITVVLENTYENTTDVITSAVEQVNSKHLKACIDTGHVNINSSLSVIDWINALGKNLHHMHLHNNFGDFDEHNSILSGTLDFQEILNHLKTNELNPNLIVEVFQENPAMESFGFIKNQLNLISKA
ncbi:MAG: hypothetical protein A2104_03705 [Candidatus Melainabacteria bacterium GWF2_32_7]|nr:MAG: hypothetical protein A2104_03705 [Candidatus Melainabacteria bacterium GWF2_32_7]